jgi:RNA polymerase sigma-70 factor (ECF subfamily)
LESLDLITRCKNGDRKAFDELFKTHNNQIMAYVGQIVKENIDIKEDIAQQTRIKIFNSIHAFRGDCKFSVWMYQIIKNNYIDYIKKHQKDKIKLVYLEETDNPLEQSCDIENNIDPLCDLIEKENKQEIVNNIKTSMLKLPPEQREILKLYYFDCKKYIEISDHLCIPLGLVKSRMYRSRNKLKFEYEKNLCNN